MVIAGSKLLTCPITELTFQNGIKCKKYNEQEKDELLLSIN